MTSNRQGSSREHLIRHIVFPALLSILFFINAAIPAVVLGCLNRGLIACIIALTSGIAAIATGIKAVIGRFRNDPRSFWWVITTLILTIPVVALLILA